MQDKVLIDFTEFFENQTQDETIQVLDDVLAFLVLYAEENGLDGKLSHRYLTIRDLRDLLMGVGKG